MNIDIHQFSIELFNYLRPGDLNYNCAISNKNEIIKLFLSVYSTRFSDLEDFYSTYDKEIFYDMTSGLKVKEVQTVKTPDGKEVKVPTTFADYKAVNGIMFPHSVALKSGPMTLDFKVKEIKINEGVSEEDFK